LITAAAGRCVKINKIYFMNQMIISCVLTIRGCYINQHLSR
jgi:hypothetical protein